MDHAPRKVKRQMLELQQRTVDQLVVGSPRGVERFCSVLITLAAYVKVFADPVSFLCSKAELVRHTLSMKSSQGIGLICT